MTGSYALCRDCSSRLSDHLSSVNDGQTVTCTLRNGLTMRTQSSVPVAPGTDATPDGRGDLQRRDRAGDHVAEAEHVAGLEVITCAVAFYKATDDEDVDLAVANLKAAVARYLSVAEAEATELYWANRLLKDVFPGLAEAHDAGMGL